MRSRVLLYYFPRTLLASCAPEIREFMRQLDTLLSTKKKEWKEKEEAYKMELQSRETELSSMRIALGQKEREVSAFLLNVFECNNI